ncbi:MAG: hypothetical protein V1682_02300 [Candidatus Omnitrophota bacterium]
MKKYTVICGLAMLAILVAASIGPADCFAFRQRYQQELTDDPKLAEANNIYKQAIPWIEKGDGVHQPQRAAEFYATGESYLRSAIFTLGELGDKQNIDVTKEISFCEKLERETHSKQGDAKRESKKY